MERKIFEPEHDLFRATARRFFETECAPHAAEWERNGITPREPWLRAGELGLLKLAPVGGGDQRTSVGIREGSPDRRLSSSRCAVRCQGSSAGVPTRASGKRSASAGAKS